MKKFNKTSIVAVLVGFFALGLTGPIAAHAAGPAPVNLLSSGNFVILSKSGITNTGSHTTLITGNIGSSPITAAAMNNVFCSEITGTIYGVDAAYVGSGDQTCFAGNPPLSNKTLVDSAVLDMETAYNDAALRPGPDTTELGAGDISGMTIAPGLHKWSTDVVINTNVILSGGANDVWIFQIAGDLNIASGGSVPAGIKVVLQGGAKASNVFWQVGGGAGATLGTYSTFNGTILSAKQVVIQTGAVLHGRALAQTQVTLDANTISTPTSTPNACKNPVTQTIVSDTSDMIGGGNAVAVTPHSAWTAAISGSTTWIWQASSTPPNASVGFEKTFIVTGAGVISAILDIASDNSYKVFIDGVEVAADDNLNNFQTATQDSHDLTANITPGTHTLRIEVVNDGIFNSSSNPAGLLYKLEIITCSPPPPPPPLPTGPEETKCVDIKVGNNAVLLNSTMSRSSTGENYAGGSRGGNGKKAGDGGKGGDAEKNKRGSTNIAGNGGAGGNGGQGGRGSNGGVVITGVAGSAASTINNLNTNLIRVKKSPAI